MAVFSYTPFTFRQFEARSNVFLKAEQVDDMKVSKLLVPNEAARVILAAFNQGLRLETDSKLEAFHNFWVEWCTGLLQRCLRANTSRARQRVKPTPASPMNNQRRASRSALASQWKQLEADHEALLSAMDNITRVASEKPDDAGNILPFMLRTFAQGMSAHLDNDETFVARTVRDPGYTRQEESAMVDAVMKSLSVEAYSKTLPLIFYVLDKAGGFGPLTSSTLFAALPVHMKEALPSWKDAFETDFLEALPMLQATLIAGFRTPLVDATAIQYQAGPSFKPDKAHLWKQPASHDGWCRAHNAIRFEIGEFKRVINALRGRALVDWQILAMQTWWAGHAAHVREHDRNEDDVRIPQLRTRIVYPEKFEADHALLFETMQSIDKIMSELTPGDTLAKLRLLWNHYEATMLPHLFEEEQVGLPLARAYFTPAEVEKMTAQFVKSPLSIGAFVHVIGHKKDVQTFMRENGIPAIVWHLPGKGFKALRKLYRSKMQVHIDSLLAGEQVSARTKRSAKENAAKVAKSHDESIAMQCALSPCKRANVMTPREGHSDADVGWRHVDH